MTVTDVLLKRIEELEKENKTLTEELKQIVGILVLKCPDITEGLKQSIRGFINWVSDNEEDEQ